MQQIKSIDIRNNLTKVAVNICVATLLCGQFGFKVAAYFVDEIRPSLPFWALLYFFSMAAIYASRPKLKPIYYLAHIFFVYIIVYCIVDNNDNYAFLKNFIIYCTIPYVCGILIGKNITNLLFKIILLYSITYILLIIWQYKLIPYAFQADRLYIFEPKNWDRNGGDPTGTYLGINFGCVFIILSSYYFNSKNFLRSIIYYIFIAIIIFVLLSYGSRAAILGSYAAVFVVLIIQIFFDKKISGIKLLCILLTSYLIILNMKPERMKLIQQVSNNINIFHVKDSKKEITDTEARNLQSNQSQENANESRLVTENLTELPIEDCFKSGDSIGTRLLMYKEALRIFFYSPVKGMGPGGFGHYSCAVGDSFVSPHFLFLQILVDFGLIGGLLFALNLFFFPGFILYQKKSFKYILKNHDARLIIAIWIFFTLCEQFSGNIYHAYHYFLISGVLISKIYNYCENLNK